MSEELQSTDGVPVQEKLSRRHLFKFGAKIGAGLVAFIPAAGVLLQNAPTAQASPNSCCCTSIACYNSQYHRWFYYYNCNGVLTCNCDTPDC